MRHGFEDVDARNKCGHDESEIVAAGIISCAKPVHQVAGDRPVDIPRKEKPGPRGPGFR
jgi:hypothetical protein